MAITIEMKMTDRERELHRELTEEQAKYNGLILSAQEERNLLTVELDRYIREAQRLARHKALLEQGAERRRENALWKEGA